jgi:hypothetical protein
VPALLPLIDPARATSGVTIEAIRAMARIGMRASPAHQTALHPRFEPDGARRDAAALGESAATVSVDAFVDFLGDPLPTVGAALQAFAKRDDDTF